MRAAPIARFGLALLSLAGTGACRVGRPASDATPPRELRAPGPPPPPEVIAEDDNAITAVEMRNVRFRSAPRGVAGTRPVVRPSPEVALGIRRLSGRMPRTEPARPPNFDDARTFRLAVAYGEVGIGMTDLGRLMNEHVLAYGGAPLRRVAFSSHGSRLRMRGTLASRIPVPIALEMDVGALDGDIVMQPRSIRVLGLELAGLLAATRAPLDRFVDLSGARGIRVDGSRLVLDPQGILPPPTFEGRVSDARVEGEEVVLTFGRPEDAAPPAPRPRPAAPNYLFFRGGTIRFGRLFMVQADLQIIDADPSDAFDFDLASYARQLIAGYSRNQPGGAMLVVMPDADDLARGAEVSLPAVPGAARGDAPAMR